MTSDLLSLGERCEKATGPDSILDEAINDLLAPPRPHDPDEEPPAGFGEEKFMHLGYWGKPYTQSVDVALSLVPEGYSVALHAHCNDQSRAAVYSWLGDLAAHNFRYAATPALALCAAALRARAQSPSPKVSLNTSPDTDKE